MALRGPIPTGAPAAPSAIAQANLSAAKGKLADAQAGLMQRIIELTELQASVKSMLEPGATASPAQILTLANNIRKRLTLGLW